MISIDLITLLTLFSPLISMDKANTELRKEVREKKIKLNRMEREYGKFRINTYNALNSNNSIIGGNYKNKKRIALFNHTSTFPKESIRNTDVYKRSDEYSRF